VSKRLEPPVFPDEVVAEPEELAVSDGAGELQADRVATESVAASNKEAHLRILLYLLLATEKTKLFVMARNCTELNCTVF
jgi:hypothetical protein